MRGWADQSSHWTLAEQHNGVGSAPVLYVRVKKRELYRQTYNISGKLFFKYRFKNIEKNTTRTFRFCFIRNKTSLKIPPFVTVKLKNS